MSSRGIIDLELPLTARWRVDGPGLFDERRFRRLSVDCKSGISTCHKANALRAAIAFVKPSAQHRRLFGAVLWQRDRYGHPLACYADP
jgi:hypothetical protein